MRQQCGTESQNISRASQNLIRHEAGRFTPHLAANLHNDKSCESVPVQLLNARVAIVNDRTWHTDRRVVRVRGDTSRPGEGSTNVFAYHNYAAS